jgi:rubrerythrin
VRARRQALEVLRAAMQLEREAYTFYAAASKGTKDSNAVKMFLSLARDEMEHLGRLEAAYCALSKDSPWPSVKSSAGPVCSTLVTLQDAAPAVMPGTQELAALRQGIQAEMDSIAFYQQALDGTADPHAQAMYEWLVGEEERHLSILRAEYDCVTQTGVWVNYHQFTIQVGD